MLVGVGVLVGWWWHIPLLQSVGPGWATMKPNTAGSLILLGTALVLAREPLSRWRRFVVTVLALTVLLFGIVTIAEYASGLQSGLAGLLHDEPAGGPYTSAPGRPSPMTALALVAATSGLLLLDKQTRGGRRPTEWLAALVVTIGIGHLLGYAFDVGALYEALPGTAMAAHTSVGLILIGIGTLAARPSVGWMRIVTSASPSGMMLRRLALPLMAFTFGAGAASLAGAQAKVYPSEFAVTLIATASIVVIAALGLLNARKLERTLGASAAATEIFQNLVRSSQDAIVSTTNKHQVTSWNVGAERLFGFSAGEAIGQDLGLILPPGSDESEKAVLTRVLSGETVERREAMRRRKDGTLLEVSSSISPMRDADGQIVGAVSVSYDIGRIRRAEEKFQALLESAPDAMVISDAEGRIVLANQQAERMFGHMREDLIGKPIEMLIPQSLRMRHVHHRGRFSEDPRARPMGAGLDLRALRADGTEFPVEISLSPLMTEGGMLVSAAVRDVTERKETEERILASLREKEALLREIHHRVKNNLQVTSSLLLLQSQQVDDAPTRELFAESITRVRSMALVHEKLYGSADMTDVDFAEYVSDLVGELSRSYGAAERGVDVETHVEPIPLDLDTCSNLGLILNELVSNALKHAFPSARRGRVEVLLERDGPEHAVLTVRDNGVGFPASLDITTSPTMGLRLVDGLVRQLGGSLERERAPGTTLRVRVPIPFKREAHPEAPA